jgi:hypothetical protein
MCVDPNLPSTTHGGLDTSKNKDAMDKQSAVVMPYCAPKNTVAIKVTIQEMASNELTFHNAKGSKMRGKNCLKAMKMMALSIHLGTGLSKEVTVNKAIMIINTAMRLPYAAEPPMETTSAERLSEPEGCVMEKNEPNSEAIPCANISLLGSIS